MTEVKNGVLKYYDDKTENWVVVETEPIAEKVVEIMRDDWLAHKGQLDVILLTNIDPNNELDIHVAVFYDTSKQGTLIVDDTENFKSTLQFNLDQVVNKLSNRKLFNINDFINRLEQYDNLPEQFELYGETEDNIDGKKVVPSFKNITKNPNITSALIMEDAKLEVKYFYNGTPIEKLKYIKANQ
ncbi:hypothetical protein BU082_12575 [Staphylococcus warneri]|uniref:hypothetical protein n=1 Tax=Staphylococcus warneri TaxID=1292 RepID=UPI000D1D2EE7|nr:hypothetical protein [Staphylococcus warneri]PTI17225.1 hypothetical protein BU082_12575 [Staphylococcus warneri]PTI20706.1 hypothetical protein BU081_12720 [Staphylococcus warneri]